MKEEELIDLLQEIEVMLRMAADKIVEVYRKFEGDQMEEDTAELLFVACPACGCLNTPRESKIQAPNARRCQKCTTLFC